MYSGSQIVCYGHLKNVSGNLKSWRRFLDCGDVRDRDNLKCCARIVNLADSQFNFVTKQIVKKWNGQKFLIPPELCLFHHDAKRGYFGIDIDLFRLDSAAASKVMKFVVPEAKSLVVDLGFLLEAKAENELPEQMALCLRICKLDLQGLDSLQAMGIGFGANLKNTKKRPTRKSGRSEVRNAGDAMSGRVGMDHSKGMEVGVDSELGYWRGTGYVDLREGEFMVFREIVSNEWVLVIVVLMETDILMMTAYRLIGVNDEYLWIVYSGWTMVTVLSKLLLLLFSAGTCT